jgi:N-acetylglucosaminyldiphosphoundecaprenol N-acetyl-beta-D-mannosaminyltransferase
MMAPLQRERILDNPVHPLSNSEAIDLMVTVAFQGEPGAYVCLTNVHTTLQSQKLPKLREATDRAYVSLPDGMPLVWLLRRRGHTSTEKLTGADLMPMLASAGVECGLRHFMYAWSPLLGEAAARGLVAAAPGTQIVGVHTPPFAAEQNAQLAELRAVNPENVPLAPPWVDIGGPVQEVDWELDKLQGVLRETKPHVLWVGLGSPVQEEWMAMVAGKLDVPLMIGVGRAFNYLGGQLRRCPPWAVNVGLEWLFTLAQEPGRLWRRYLLGNTTFLFMVARDSLGTRSVTQHSPDD